MNEHSKYRGYFSSFFFMIAFFTLSLGMAGAQEYKKNLSPWTGRSFVHTRYGAVQGETDRAGTFAWRGLPYARPPVGELRWKAPRPPLSWDNVLQADRFSDASLQKLPLGNLTSGSEDSLYLNIWRPANPKASLPVYVWIHGGGNSIGSASQTTDYLGYNFASKTGSVFVSLNYRLGVFGWFRHPDLATGDPRDDSGNFGTLDLIAALSWIRDNIAAFGGDPRNVTIAGESAGAFNVLTLMLAPEARGLFHRAVVQSGYRTDATLLKAEDFAGDLAEKLAAKDGRSGPPQGASFAPWIRGLDGKTILSQVGRGVAGMSPFPYPIWDGTVLPSEGFAAFSDPRKVADVPLIIGTNKEETKVFQIFGRQDPRDPIYQIGAEVASAAWKASGADSIADAIVSADGSRKVYLYRFDWGAPDKNGKSVQPGVTGLMLGAGHGVDIPFFLQNDTLFGNLLPLPVFTSKNAPGRKALQRAMGLYLLGFMEKGEPSGLPKENLPAWKPWNSAADDPSFLILDADFEELRIREGHGRVTPDSIRKWVDSLDEGMRTRLLKAAEAYIGQ
jgi:para-nitrobenzyl esterase